ncbi:hypothetical protein [Salinicoccus sp. Marseille-QA3877]
MSVTVIRKKERVNSEWTELEVYIDGEKKLSIMGNGSSEVQLEKDSGELKVKNFMSKSVRKQVDSGDTVEVSTHPVVKYSIYLIPVMILLMTVFSYFKLLNLWILTVLTAVIIVVLMFVKPLQLKVMRPGRKKVEESQNDTSL